MSQLRIDINCKCLASGSVATGYGQPPSTLYDWTLGPSGPKEPRFRLSTDLEARLLIEKFCNKVTKALYSNNSDSVGLIDDAERPALTTFLARDYEELKETLKPTISCTLTSLCVFGSICVLPEFLNRLWHSTASPLLLLTLFRLISH